MAEIAAATLAVGVFTLAVNGTSTVMQAHQMRREKKKKAKANAGLVPYGGITSAQQSSTNLSPYGNAPPQYPLQPQPSPEIKPQYTGDGKVSYTTSPAQSPRPRLDAQSGWTTMQKVETTTYYLQNGQPFAADSKQDYLQPTPSYQNFVSPPASPSSSPSYISYPSPPPSPQPTPPAFQQQQQPQWYAAQASGYVPGQGQVSGFYTSAPQCVASPPPYQQVQAPKRHRLRPWS